MPEKTRGVALDASVLINVLHVERLPLLVQLPGLRLLVPVEVLEEILRADQRAAVDAAIAAGDVERVSLDDPAVIEAYATYRSSLGKGEAACLALAGHRGLLVACDEKRAFARMAAERLGPNRVITTVDVLLRAITAGLLSIEDADRIKAVLEGFRYRMPFTSFRELVSPARRTDDAY